MPTNPAKGEGSGKKPIQVKCLPKAKDPKGATKAMSLHKASKPATLEERLVAGALQPSMVKQALTF